MSPATEVQGSDSGSETDDSEGDICIGDVGSELHLHSGKEVLIRNGRLAVNLKHRVARERFVVVVVVIVVVVVCARGIWNRYPYIRTQVLCVGFVMVLVNARLLLFGLGLGLGVDSCLIVAAFLLPCGTW